MEKADHGVEPALKLYAYAFIGPLLTVSEPFYQHGFGCRFQNGETVDFKALA